MPADPTADAHFADAADLAREAMAATLSALHAACHGAGPGAALTEARTLAGLTAGIDAALADAGRHLEDGHDDEAALDCARVMVLAERAATLARLRLVAAQIGDCDAAHSGQVA